MERQKTADVTINKFEEVNISLQANSLLERTQLTGTNDLGKRKTGGASASELRTEIKWQLNGII